MGSFTSQITERGRRGIELATLLYCDCYLTHVLPLIGVIGISMDGADTRRDTVLCGERGGELG